MITSIYIDFKEHKVALHAQQTNTKNKTGNGPKLNIKRRKGEFLVGRVGNEKILAKFI